MNTPHIVFVNNVIMNIGSPINRMKYELLSERYSGLVFFLNDGKPNPDIGNFKCLSVPYYGPIKRLIAYTLFCLKKSLAVKKVDLVVVNDPLLPGIVGCLLKFCTGAKLIVEVNTNNADAMKWCGFGLLARVKRRLVPMVTRSVLGYADAVKFVSEGLRRDLTRSLALPEEKTTSFFDFVPTSVFRKSPPEVPKYVLFAGFPYQIKGVDVLIRAFNLVSADYPSVRLKIIGHCDDLAPYRALSKGNTAIEFYRGVPYNEIVREFEGCLFYIQPSRSEGLPRAVIDAMSAGKAVIGSRVGGMPELIEEGVNGLLFECEDHEMLAEKIRLLLSDEAMRSRLGDAGYGIIQERYTPRRYLQHYKKLIDAVLSPSSCRASASGLGEGMS